MEYNKLAYKIYSIITYSDNTGITIIIGIREIVTVEFWSLVLLCRVRGRRSLTLILKFEKVRYIITVDKLNHLSPFQLVIFVSRVQ